MTEWARWYRVWRATGIDPRAWWALSQEARDALLRGVDEPVSGE